MADRAKYVDGYCPKQNKEYEVCVNYVDASNMNRTIYIKGLGECDYASRYGCEIHPCPIMESAPKEIS